MAGFGDPALHQTHSPMSKIVKVEIGRFDYAVAGEFKFFTPGPDGRVTRPSVLVRLTDDGRPNRLGPGRARAIVDLRDGRDSAHDAAALSRAAHARTAIPRTSPGFTR